MANVLRLVDTSSTFSSFIDSNKIHSLSTAKAYETDCNQIAMFLFQKKMVFVTVEEIQSLTVNDIVRLQIAMKDSFKASTVNRKMQSFNSYMNYLRSHGNVIHDVLGGVRAISKSDEEQHEVMTLEHYQLLESFTVRDDLKELFKLALFTGLRRNAMFSIDKSKLSMKDGNYFVTVTEKGGEKITRQIPQSSYDYILSSSKENPYQIRPNTITDHFNKFAESCGVKYSLHSIRKLAINSVMEKSDIKTAQLFANHASASTTLSHYLKNNDESSTVGMNLINSDKVTELDFESFSKEQLIKSIMKLTESEKQKVLKNIE